jgi:hypothetical protein
MRFSFALLTLALAGAASAAAVNVSYTVSGTSGAYVLDFSVNNNISSGQGVYFFGVQLSSSSIVNSPSRNFVPNAWWDNSPYGGSSTIYNNNWLNWLDSGVTYGSTVSGFQVAISDLTPPTSVQWFAYGYGTDYTAPDHFWTDKNPGFEGTANPVPEPVPEPMSMVALGLGTVALLKRRRK